MRRRIGPNRAVSGALLAALALAASGCRPPGGNLRSPEIAPGGVLFRYRAPAARVVQLAGSWDGNTFLGGRDWTSDTRVGLLQDPEKDGTWELCVPLGPGRYEYLFLVDGRFWELDPANPERVPDGSGGSHSLLVVP